VEVGFGDDFRPGFWAKAAPSIGDRPPSVVSGGSTRQDFIDCVLRKGFPTAATILLLVALLFLSNLIHLRVEGVPQVPRIPRLHL
jgi:hypothetical protein